MDLDARRPRCGRRAYEGDILPNRQTDTSFDAPAGCRHEIFESINRSGEFAHLLTVPDYATALEVTENCRIGAPAYRFRVCEVERDYGMFERGEAPQYYPRDKP